MGKIAQLWVKINADIAELEKGFAEMEKATQKIGKSMSSAGSILTKGLTLPMAALGGVAIAAAETMDDALDTIRSGTGATGAKLGELEGVFRETFGKLPVSAGAAATAITELTKRTDASGPALAGLAEQVLNVSRLTKEDLGQTIAASTRLFGDWSISAEKQASTMDLMFRASQQTGIGFNELSEKLVQFGAPLRQVGFSLEESAAMLGKWEKEGVNTELVLGSLRIGLGKFAKAGLDAPAALREVIEKIQTMGSASDATGIAIETFGARAGPDMAAAIREGRFAVDDLVKQISGGSDMIAQAAKDTDGWRESLTKLMNRATEALEPIGIQLVAALEKLMPLFISGIEFVTNLTTKFANLSPEAQKFALVGAAIAFALGPVLSLLGTLVTMAPAIGKAFTVMTGPVGLAIAAFVSMVLAGKALIDNWAIIKYEVGRLIDGIRDAFVNRFKAIVDSVKQKVEAITGFFKDLYHKVVGGSYVPDMLTGIEREFKKLEPKMVQPARKATMDVAAAFSAMGLSVDLVEKAFDRQEAVQNRLKDLRFDLVLAADAKEAKSLKENIAEAEAELRKLQTIMAAKEFQDFVRLMQQLPQISVGIAGPKGGMEQDKDTGLFFNADLFKSVNEELGKLIPAVADSTSRVSDTTRALVLLDSAGGWLKDRFFDIGKAVADAFQGMFKKLGDAFNPLSIISNVFGQAVSQASSAVDGKFKTSIEKMSGIIAESLGPVMEALVPVFDALTPIIKDLSPILRAVAQIFGALFKALAPILGAVVPLLRALFPVFKFLAIVTTYVGQVFAKAGQIIFTISSFIAKAVGSVIKGIGTLIDKIPGLGDFGLKKAGQGLINIGNELGNSADAFGEAFTELGKARDEIKKIELDEPMQEAADAVDHLGDSARGATSALQGLGNTVLSPNGFGASTPSPSGGGGLISGGNTFTGDLHVHGVEDVDGMVKGLERKASIEARRGGTTNLQLALSSKT